MIDMYLIEHFVLNYVNNIKIGIHISSLIHEYMVTHTLWLVFYINNNINNILIMIKIII